MVLGCAERKLPQCVVLLCGAELVKVQTLGRGSRAAETGGVCRDLKLLDWVGVVLVLVREWSRSVFGVVRISMGMFELVFIY